MTDQEAREFFKKEGLMKNKKRKRIVTTGEPTEIQPVFKMTPVTPESYDGSKSKPLHADETGHISFGKSGTYKTTNPDMIEHLETYPLNQANRNNLTVRVVSEKQPIIIRVTHEGVYSNLHGKYFDVAHGELDVEGLNRID